jgi:hypothetical protein
MKIVLFALMVSIFTGCAAPPYEQKIGGEVLKGEMPAANVKIRFISEYPEDKCESRGLEGTTDQSGKFSFNQLYTPANTENYAVVIHPYRLCIFIDREWKTVWKLTTGPAPKSIDFRCVLDKNGGAKCKVSWNGQNFSD